MVLRPHYADGGTVSHTIKEIIIQQNNNDQEMKVKHLLAASLMMLGTGNICAQKSANSIFNAIKERVSLSGYAQAGFSSLWLPTASSEKENYNTFDVKRITLRDNVAITDKWSVTFISDFAKRYTNLELYTSFRTCSGFGIRLGQFKTAFSIENQLSPTTIETISCGSMATNFLAAGNGSDPLMGAQSGRDVGLEIYGDLFNEILGYRLGVLNGQGINTLDGSKHKTLEGSLTLRPIECLSFTGSFMSGKTAALNDAPIKINSKQIMAGDLYDRSRWSVGGMFRSKYFDLRSEYLEGKDDDMISKGFYVTGVGRLFKNLDIIGSYDFMDLYERQQVHNITAGLQYWFFPKCRLQAQYVLSNPKGEYNNTHALLTQVQVAF